MKKFDVVAQAEKRASEIWGKIKGLHESLPQTVFDMQELCNSIPGVSMTAEYLPSDISGVIAKQSDGEYAIQVNAGEAPARQRFTAAHELAHYILHREQIDRAPDGMLRENNFLRGGGLSMTNWQETEANKLAAEILMPYNELFKFMADQPNYTMRELADRFQVSPAAMAIRLGIPVG